MSDNNLILNQKHTMAYRKTPIDRCMFFCCTKIAICEIKPLFYIHKNTYTRGEITMRHYFKRYASMALGLVMALSISACGKSDSTATTAAATSSAANTSASSAAAEGDLPSKDTKFKDVMNIAVAQEGATYDVHKTTTLVARQVFAGTVWEKLVTLDSKSEVVPELCSSWDMSEDAKTFTFHLRKGVMFHDGTEMKAADVVASMNRWLGAYSTTKGLVGEGKFEAVDDYTVKIVCDSPALTLLEMMAGSAQPAIVTTAAACSNEDDKGYLKDYIGTGPYKFVEWIQDQYITLEKFDGYVPYYLEGSTEEKMDGWAGYKHAYTKTLKFFYVAEEATRVAGLQTGQYDAIFSVSSDNYDMIASIPDLKIEAEQAGTVALVFNKSEESIAKDINIRKAVNAIANSDDLLKASFGSFYDLGSCYMDASNAFWVTEAGSENYNKKDAELAKKYLADSSYKGETFKILAPTLSHYDNMGLVLKTQLEAIGMKAEVTSVDWATFTQYRTDKKSFDIYITSFASVPVPSLKAYYGPSYPGWSTDEKLATLLNAFNASTTKEAAYKAWEELQTYSWDYLPCISAGHYNTSYAWNKNVNGIYMGNGIYFWNAYIEQ